MKIQIEEIYTWFGWEKDHAQKLMDEGADFPYYLLPRHATIERQAGKPWVLLVNMDLRKGIK